ncbi:MAG: sialate O-acetylesterase, partial [Bacteroidota bacterium]
MSDNMVLQQKSTVKVWGWTTQVAEKITVTGSWNNQEVTVNAIRGKWSATLATPSAGGPYSVSIQGHETLMINNVLIGEVWLASGQSNMEWSPMHGLDNAEAEIANANYPKIRFFQVYKHIAPYPQEDLYGEWVECAPETVKHFSSVAYFFGRSLYSKLTLPVGLINSSWGGTPVETWISEGALSSKWDMQTESTKIVGNHWRPHEPGAAFNAMISPLTNFDIAGCIWYQGESNRVNARSYYTSFPVLIRSWRQLWGADFPFYFVQIAPFDYKDGNNRLGAALVRDAQLHTMRHVPNTGMAVTNDIGNVANIHPENKQEVGRRLALWALARQYGISDLASGGPG